MELGRIQLEADADVRWSLPYTVTNMHKLDRLQYIGLWSTAVASLEYEAWYPAACSSRSILVTPVRLPVPASTAAVEENAFDSSNSPTGPRVVPLVRAFI
jgi:hypothetical protein